MYGYLLRTLSIQISKTKLLVKMASESRRFANLTEEDLQKLPINKDSKQTKAVIEKSVGIFRSYCENREYVFSEVKKYDDSELSSLLRKFYTEVHTKSGDYYAKNSMQTMRYGLQIGWQVSLTRVAYILNLFISKIFMRYIVRP